MKLHSIFGINGLARTCLCCGKIIGYTPVGDNVDEDLSNSKQIADATVCKECIDKLDRNNILILVDLYGGTPFNIANIFLHKKNNIRLIAGMNLAMIIEYFSSNTEDLDVLVNEIIKAGKDNISIPMLEEYNNIELDE